jgi:hypothetical protein
MVVQRQERGLETSVNKLLFAGSRMSVLRLGLSLSEIGRRSCDRPHRMIGTSPAVASLPPLHEFDSSGPGRRQRLMMLCDEG